LNNYEDSVGFQRIDWGRDRVCDGDVLKLKLLEIMPGQSRFGRLPGVFPTNQRVSFLSLTKNKSRLPFSIFQHIYSEL
jgi:hypothetical protein